MNKLKKWMNDNEVTQKQIAKDLGVSQAAISDWLANGVPPRRVLAVEKYTGGAVKREEIRPDIYA